RCGPANNLAKSHLSRDRIICLNKRYSYIPIPVHSACDVCHMARQNKLSFNKNNNRATDLYFLKVVDDKSRYIWVMMLKLKSEVPRHVVNFVAMIETQFNKRVKVIRSDNGTEFILKDFYANKGIVHQTNCVATPQKNGRVERRH
ncbi:hypothetical protein CR513_23739, partial [Mucuna pruriens]